MASTAAVRNATPGEIPPAMDLELFQIATLERAEAPGTGYTRAVYRTKDKRDVMLAEHCGSSAIQIGRRVGRVEARKLARDIAADILMSRTPVDDDMHTLALAIVDQGVLIDELRARLIRAESAAGRAVA